MSDDLVRTEVCMRGRGGVESLAAKCFFQALEKA